MTRINDNLPGDSSKDQTIRELALRVNQLERLLDGKEITEVSFVNGQSAQRTVRFSLNGGMSRGDWVAVETALPAGGSQYQVLQRDGSGNAVWDWVRAHA